MAPLPLVLAGPIVRRVEAQSCSFWIALREKAEVTASIWQGLQVAGTAVRSVVSGDSPLATDKADTVPLGTNLHIAVVTLQLAGGNPPLLPGTLYAYHISFTSASGEGDLRSAGLLRDEPAGNRIPDVDPAAPLHLALGYAENRLPSFLTPAATVERLRLAHASCRKTNGPDFDALGWLDDEIEKNLTDLEARTQQLYLTGDQIYADDLAAVLLPMLNELGRDLLGGQENLPVKGSDVAATMDHFPALRRQRLTRQHAGFTSTSGHNHLLSFGEYAAMYLIAWSPRVWRALAEPADLFTPLTAVPAALRDTLTDWETCLDSLANWRDKKLTGVERERDRVMVYSGAVPKVARALANVATYMMMDDHEVTDDWNLNRRWRNRVYSKPLGKAVVRNAVMAFGLFQGWGNDPAAFKKGNNKAFLDEAQKVLAGSGPFPAASTDKLDELFGSTDAGGGKQVTWHFRVPGPRHLTVVLDTRTRRSFRGQGFLPPDLLGSSLNSQVPKGPFTDGRELLILISPVPVLGPSLIEHIGQPLAQMIVDAKAATFDKLFPDEEDPCEKAGPIAGAEAFDAESWVANEDALEKFLKRLSGYDKVVILSGDVHYGMSLTLDYWRKGAAAPSRFAQLTASPSRNNFKREVEAIVRSNALLQRYAQGLPAERLAWNGKAPITLADGARIGPGRRARMNRSPALLPSRGWPEGTTIPDDKPPDWRWRLQVVRDGRPNSALPLALQQEVLTEDLDPDDPLPGYRALAARHARAAMTHFDHLRQMVFACNIGLVSLGTADGSLQLTHTLLSKDGPDSQTPAPNTVHEISLTPTSDPPPVLEVSDGG